LHLSNAIPREDAVAMNSWVYYKYQVPDSESSLTLAVGETNTTGKIWVYVNQGAPPTLNNYEYEEVNLRSPYHTIYTRTKGVAEDVYYYIGIYGNPYGDIAHKTDYHIIAYSPVL